MMETRPLIVTRHALLRYADRTNNHLLWCKKGTANCERCRAERKIVRAAVNLIRAGGEIQERVERGDYVKEYTRSADDGVVRTVVVLEESGMQFIVALEEFRDVVLTCHPPAKPVKFPKIDNRAPPLEREMSMKGKHASRTRKLRRLRAAEEDDEWKRNW